jgi:hypothetical protein
MGVLSEVREGSGAHAKIATIEPRQLSQREPKVGERYALVTDAVIRKHPARFFQESAAATG